MKSVLKKTLLLGIPLLFGQLTHYFHQIADSDMLGHFGNNSLELAAIGIAGLLTWLSFGLYQMAHASLIITGFFRKKWLIIEVDRTAS
ncbi:hypothetical protein [Oceanispirochaeta sp.]|uniref:hypothetical protein n=1 Tax=Oceanispirochaeta sp. TaxID=2035350 RepID=UPI0026337EE5|nr:hypothetical protein [Oceanispirochaeta sp.]MDA3958215.1 hypothetical protein [Oceanispirochaeta sp.]